MDRRRPEITLQDCKRQRELEFQSVLGKRLSPSEADELEQILAKKKARLGEEHRLLEAPWTHLPPLPPALPDYREISIDLGDPWEVEFSGWCRDGKRDAIEEYIEAQDDEVSEVLLQRGLASACEGGRAHVARYLLQKGAKVYGRAVELASRRCDLALFEVFVEHGWHPNQQVPWVQGAFGVALPHCTDDIRVVEFLLTHGADPNLGPFDFRKITGSSMTPPLDRCSGAPLNKAARSGSIEVIDLLLQHGAVLEWSTPLHYALASWPRNRPAFVHLLHLGADPNKNIHYDYCTQGEGGTPLYQAIRFHNWDAIELLLESGADPEKCDMYTTIAEMDIRAKNQDNSLTKTFTALVDKVKQKKKGSS
ncbi:hypothetical protein ANO14919_121870 [Xylariales sp. No.14919]|nr:hypothetical protein ANO14919_121870 [Xylariales sp. No.14919]